MVQIGENKGLFTTSIQRGDDARGSIHFRRARQATVRLVLLAVAWSVRGLALGRGPRSYSLQERQLYVAVTGRYVERRPTLAERPA